MVWNKPTLISLPTVLAGLVLGCLPSPAHGHGNNPRPETRLWDREPPWPPYIDSDTDTPADTANALGNPGGNLGGPGPDAMDLLGELGVNLGANAAFGAAGPDLDLGGLSGADYQDPPDAMTANGNYIWGPIDADLLTAAVDRGFHSTESNVLTGPQGGTIPAPATLALLGLAGASLAGRRRRRT